MRLGKLAQMGITRARLPQWNDSAYLKINPIGDFIGPWAVLHDKSNGDEPMNLLVMSVDCEDYVEYKGGVRDIEKP